MWTELMVKLGKMFLNWGANLLWDYADTDGDGDLSQREFTTLFNKIRKLLSK